MCSRREAHDFVTIAPSLVAPSRQLHHALRSDALSYARRAREGTTRPHRHLAPDDPFSAAGQGRGQAARRAATRPSIPPMRRSYVPLEGNLSAFYKKLGFVETGEMDEGTVVMTQTVAGLPPRAPYFLLLQRTAKRAGDIKKIARPPLNCPWTQYKNTKPIATTERARLMCRNRSAHKYLYFGVACLYYGRQH